MSGKNWTAGPWGVTTDHLSVRSSHTADNDYASEHICTMDFYREDRIDRAANANLIASAPELYESLEKLLSAIDSCTELTPELLRACEKTLARARGEK